MPKPKSLPIVKRIVTKNFFAGVLVGILFAAVCTFIYLHLNTPVPVETNAPTNAVTREACLAVCKQKLEECHQVYPEGHPGRFGCVQMKTKCAEACPIPHATPQVFQGTKK